MPTEERKPNPTLPPPEFERLERLAKELGYSTAGFARVLLRFALPRWRDALDEARKRAEAHDADDTEGSSLGGA